MSKTGKDPGDHSLDEETEAQEGKCLTQNPTIQPGYRHAINFSLE